MADFDTERELAALKSQTRTIRHRGLRKSRLDRHTAELLSLYQAGATAAELHRWLRHKKRLRVSASTVTRWLKRRAEV
ncbi:TPA: hypothetical protein JG914_000085 [Enterobacter hormaechei subsp. steigerwaltii]|nr:hypothetical protein [Enterobacter hormaechei subsp. steigerwaltii]